MVDVLLDSLMALLLLFTILVCWKLNGRIKVLQDSKEELAETIREFDACTQRAAKSIAEIHTATQRISENIQHRIDKESFIADDLEIMINRGNKIMGGSTGAGAATKESRPAKRKPALRKEREEAPEAAPAIKRKPRAAFVDDPNKVTDVDTAQQAAPKPSAEASPRARNRAEEELLQAVKSASDEVV